MCVPVVNDSLRSGSPLIHGGGGQGGSAVASGRATGPCACAVRLTCLSATARPTGPLAIHLWQERRQQQPALALGIKWRRGFSAWYSAPTMTSQCDQQKVNSLLVTKGAVTQGTSITTAVSLNKAAGVITTQAASAAAGAVQAFTFSNQYINADSVVIVSVVDYAGTITTNGLPFVTVDSIAAGSCVIRVCNAHGTNALSGALQIAFLVC